MRHTGAAGDVDGGEHSRSAPGIGRVLRQPQPSPAWKHLRVKARKPGTRRRTSTRNRSCGRTALCLSGGGNEVPWRCPYLAPLRAHSSTPVRPNMRSDDCLRFPWPGSSKRPDTPRYGRVGQNTESRQPRAQRARRSRDDREASLSGGLLMACHPDVSPFCLRKSTSLRADHVVCAEVRGHGIGGHGLRRWPRGL